MEGFSAWKVGLPYYGSLLVGGGLLVALMPGTPFFVPGILFLLLGCFTLNFFRDPHRTIPEDPAAIVSPADGKIVAIEELEDSPHYEGPCRRVSIFLNVFNVHVNRAPCSGTVTRRVYQEGRYLNAADPESSELNESAALMMATDFGPVTVRQIAGLIARRIVCLADIDDELGKGQRFGMIKFGSRTELYVPHDCEIMAYPGQKVKGGSTILALIPTGVSVS